MPKITLHTYWRSSSAYRVRIALAAKAIPYEPIFVNLLEGEQRKTPYVETSPMGYVQMWGFPTAADMAMGKAGLKLIAELQVPLLSDTVITGSYEPLRM